MAPLSYDLSGKVALVTGASYGLGAEFSAALAAAGADLILTARSAELLEQTKARVEAAGRQATVVAGDVSKEEDVLRVVQTGLAERGRIDVLVNNAAIPQPKRILEITEAEWDIGVAVNLKGYFNWSQAVAPGMLAAGGGRIVNMSSVSAHSGPSPHAASRFAYSATKAGVLGLTKGLARELAPTIPVNAVCPGPILTERTQASFAPHMDRLPQAIPLGRLGTPEDIAMVVAFLATAEPMFLTGEVIDVDGGANMN
jgi:NAD(P)-dependent dehydrogenase (short-subunit alcohol dehydrogenase family)